MAIEPSGSEASTAIVTVAGASRDILLIGDMIAIDGARLTALTAFSTTILTAEETVLAPRLSVAAAVIEYEPSLTSFHVKDHGSEVRSPSLVVHYKTPP